MNSTEPGTNSSARGRRAQKTSKSWRPLWRPTLCRSGCRQPGSMASTNPSLPQKQNRRKAGERGPHPRRATRRHSFAGQACCLATRPCCPCRLLLPLLVARLSSLLDFQVSTDADGQAPSAGAGTGSRVQGLALVPVAPGESPDSRCGLPVVKCGDADLLPGCRFRAPKPTTSDGAERWQAKVVAGVSRAVAELCVWQDVTPLPLNLGKSRKGRGMRDCRCRW